MLLMTETNLDVFHAQLLAPQDAPAMDQLCAACGTPGRPRYRRAAADQCRSGGLCRNRHVTGRHGHVAHVWAKAVWRSRCAQLALGQDGQGIVLAPPPLPRSTCRCGAFCLALGLAKPALRQLPYLGRPPLTPTPDGEELCAQYLASGLPARRGAAGQPAAAGVCGPHPGGPRQHGAPRTLAGPRPAAPFGARRRRGRFWLG